MSILIVKKKYGSFQVNGNEFEGAKNANKCLPYDFVIPTSSGCSLSRRNEHPLLVGLLQTTSAKYGFTSKGNPIYLCKPFDEMYPPFYIGSKIIDNVKNKNCRPQKPSDTLTHRGFLSISIALVGMLYCLAVLKNCQGLLL